MISKPCHIFSGPLDGEEQAVPRAELKTIAQALENGRLALRILTDHRNHMIPFEKGRKYCRRPGNRQADI